MRSVIFVLSFLLFFSVVRAQEARTLFDSIPGSMLPLLSPVNRADFIDFLDSKMKAVVKNKFDGTSEMTDLTDNYIRIKLTDRSTWEMKVLPVNDSTKVICVVSTVCAPVCDSSVAFYTTGWKSLPVSDYLTPPVMDDYFLLADSAQLGDYDRYRQRMDMLLATVALSKDADTLTFTLTTPEYTADAGTFLRGPLAYVWGYDPLKGRYAFKK